MNQVLVGLKPAGLFRMINKSCTGRFAGIGATGDVVPSGRRGWNGFFFTSPTRHQFLPYFYKLPV
jgi:hypothetical protein